MSGWLQQPDNLESAPWPERFRLLAALVQKINGFLLAESTITAVELLPILHEKLVLY
jgi:hypothetical protein